MTGNLTVCFFLWHLFLVIHGGISAFAYAVVIRWIMARCYSGPPKVPSLNLAVNVWQNFVGLFVQPPVILPTLITVCNLSMGDKIYGYTGANSQVYVGFAKATDVHWNRAGGGFDYLEVPAGSGMFYKILAVEDVGRGFPNEWRCSIVQHYGVSPDPLP